MMGNNGEMMFLCTIYKKINGNILLLMKIIQLIIKKIIYNYNNNNHNNNNNHQDQDVDILH